MNGMLKEKLTTIESSVNTKWMPVLGTGSHYLKKDRSITADKNKGVTENATSDFLVANITLNMQNYRSYLCLPLVLV
jgi:hypothetical protein